MVLCGHAGSYSVALSLKLTSIVVCMMAKGPGIQVVIGFYAKWHCESLADQTLEGPTLACV